jgi:Protein of unknown function (DUF2569)
MENDSLKEMEQRYISWSTEDLIRSTTFERNQYEGEAIALMENELKKRGTPQEELDLAQENVKSRIAEDVRKLTGIKGVLLLFIILLIFNLLYIFGVGLTGLIRMFENPSVVLLVLSTCYLSVGMYGVFTLILLLRKRSSAPNHTLRWIYCTLGVGVLNIAVSFVVFDKLELSAASGPIVFSLVWVTYFTKSRRVAITYRIENNDL